MDEQRDNEGGGAVAQIRYSPKRLLISFALVGLGVSILARFFWLELKYPQSTGLLILFFWLTGPMIGLGLFYPSRRLLLGLIFGIELQVLFFLAALAIAFRHG